VLFRSVMDAKVGAIGAELLGRDGQLDRLLQHVACGSHDGLARCIPMTKGEEANFLHGAKLIGAGKSLLVRILTRLE